MPLGTAAVMGSHTVLISATAFAMSFCVCCTPASEHAQTLNLPSCVPNLAHVLHALAACELGPKTLPGSVGRARNGVNLPRSERDRLARSGDHVREHAVVLGRLPGGVLDRHSTKSKRALGAIDKARDLVDIAAGHGLLNKAGA